jgi:hypothetical protein
MLKDCDTLEHKYKQSGPYNVRVSYPRTLFQSTLCKLPRRATAIHCHHCAPNFAKSV